ncbi:Imm32 family immunity protein [Chromobacterium vaccinii]|uniref:Imm32 family immunity protein n=1 Tax=Chromobacterium vaccinii TaxID=1108595 RepID=UPI001364E15F|nr:Imm32 family immunity protein [Chromobacterium vaccinii]
MKNTSPLLSVCSNSTGDEVHIHANIQGLTILQNAISNLQQKLIAGQCDHEHFRSSEWAGFELTVTMLESEIKSDCKQVHHLEVFAWTDEWREKSDL